MRGFQLPAATLSALTHLAAALLVLVLSIAAFVIATPAGIGLTFALTLLLAIMLPSATPVLLAISFMFQNMIISLFIPLMQNDAAFDTVRGANFVILLTATGAFGLAALLHPERLSAPARHWIRLLIAVMAIVTLYLALGAARGNMKDALIYFRNTLTPLSCLGIGIIAASSGRVRLDRVLLWLGVAAAIYGYCELFFTFDFLSLFNGDDYFRLRLSGQIESGYWDRILARTGFVLRSLEDTMRVPFLNMAIFDQWFPRVFRLSGPNIHPISYAYALSVISTFMLFSRRTWFVFLALPLLVIIGSKGALILLLCAMAMKFGVALFGLRITTIAFVLSLLAYVSIAILYGRANADYHVLGLMAGIRDFLRNPLGQGLGFGGNLSSSIKNVLSWSRAQQQGIADIPVESAIGVMLYQMGIAATAYFAFLLGLARACYLAFQRSGNPRFLFALIATVTIFTNALLQEEAIYSPLALGLALLLVGISLGEYWKGKYTPSPKGYAVRFPPTFHPEAQR